MDEESDGESTEEDEVTGVERDEELESETTEISTRRLAERNACGQMLSASEVTTLWCYTNLFLLLLLF